MVVRLTRHYTFLFLVLVAFQQSCRTGPVAPAPQRAPEPEKSESSGKSDAQTKSESTPIDRERSKDPQLSSEPKHAERLPESFVGAPGKDLASTRIAYDTVPTGKITPGTDPRRVAIPKGSAKPNRRL